MLFVTLFLFLAFIVFIYLGVYVFLLNRKAALNRVFMALYFSFAFWSLCNVFLSVADREGSFLWYKIASIAYCAYPGLALQFFMTYTEKDKIFKKWWGYLLVYLPWVIFVIQAFRNDVLVEDFFYRNGSWFRISNTGSFWFWAYYFMYGVYCIFGFILCIMKGRKTPVYREKKQVKIIITSAILTFTIASVFSETHCFPSLDLPVLIPAVILIWAVGFWYAIVRYRLMILSPTLAAEEIFKLTVDILILADPEGMIIKINPETERLLKYNNDELQNRPLQMLLEQENQETEQSIYELLKRSPVRNIETRFIKKSGETIPIILSASECTDKDGYTIGYIIAAKDITEIKNAEERLRYYAHHDFLTNLPNRILLEECLSVAVANAKRKGTFIAFLLLDLDHEGDMLLVKVAKRLKAEIRDVDVISRFGGDEFIILLNDLDSKKDVEIIAERILKSFDDPFTIADSIEVFITVSIGISTYPKDTATPEELIKKADLAMYSAKKEGMNKYAFYSPALLQSDRHRNCVNEIPQA